MRFLTPFFRLTRVSLPCHACFPPHPTVLAGKRRVAQVAAATALKELTRSGGAKAGGWVGGGGGGGGGEAAAAASGTSASTTNKEAGAPPPSEEEILAAVRKSLGVFKQ